MNSAPDLEMMVLRWQDQGKSKSEIIWLAAQLCVGWPYVFGAVGQLCTPANRRAKYNAKKGHETIKTACRNFDGDAGCTGCKWYPDGQRVRMFDCQGFCKKTAELAGVTLKGAGCTSMWDDDSLWEAKGEIADLPEDQLVCVFVAKGVKMEHMGWSWGGETIECSVGVQQSSKLAGKWTHWARPKGLDGEAPKPVKVPTLRKGSSGQYVIDLQETLVSLGYDLGSYGPEGNGIDGKYGKRTEDAVRAFQRKHGLKEDGIVGAETWAALDAEMDPEKPAMYSISIPHLSYEQASGLAAAYPGSIVTKE